MQRNTVQKTLILQTVRSMTNHPTAEEVFEKVSSLCPNISRATVYRVLNTFADEGEILRVSVANAPDRYDFTIENHAHCLCTVCGRVFDYKMCAMPELNDEKNDGFTAKGFYLIVNGICKDCKIKKEKGDVSA
jgi:Fe2+ or Zn2+ uptake regulation protein